jgi:hypothetical protein
MDSATEYLAHLFDVVWTEIVHTSLEERRPVSVKQKKRYGIRPRQWSPSASVQGLLSSIMQAFRKHGYCPVKLVADIRSVKYYLSLKELVDTDCE